MHKKTNLVLSLVALFLVSQTTQANNIEKGKENYSATKKTISKIDGDLSDWAGITMWKDVKFMIPKAAPSKLVSFETLKGANAIASDAESVWSGPADHSNAWAITWDDGNLYIGMIVTDDYHQNSAAGNVSSAWNGDSLQVLFSDGDRTADFARYNYALDGEEGATGDVLIHEEKGTGGTEAMVVRNAAKKETYYEIKCPAASLDVAKFEAGMKFGVGLCANDGDQDTPGQRGWSGWGVHSIVHGKTAAEAGLVTLVAGAPAGPPTLSIGIVNKNLVINYTGTLQAADTVPGKWADLGTTGSLTVPLTEAVQKTQRYFRSVNK